MKEAGEVIDMLDKYIIKDLLFATATYEDSANGKMMLGITFALSKQYSEHLSESVLRGYQRRIDEGKYLGKMVHGYRIMDEGFLEPDGNNFLIIQQAFRKRLQSNRESNVEIAKWLNKQDYTQCYGRKQVRSRTHFNDKKYPKCCVRLSTAASCNMVLPSQLIWWSCTALKQLLRWMSF
jgi:DNA invertase Pin-like site-specific DNA recombinase